MKVVAFLGIALVGIAGCKPVNESSGGGSAALSTKSVIAPVAPEVTSAVKKETMKEQPRQSDVKATGAPSATTNLSKTEAEWKQKLSAEEYRVLREKGTEHAFTGKYWDTPGGSGEYRCAACDNLLFKGTDKFVSECGWPAFDKAIKGSIKYESDRTFGMVRTEVMCSRCGGHLGHVFEDGPEDTTGIRYCINSVSIKYTPDETKKDVEKEAISEVK